MASATWDGKDLSAIQMLDAKRVNGVPAVTVDQGTWDLRVRGYEGVVPVGSVIRESPGGELGVTAPHRHDHVDGYGVTDCWDDCIWARIS